MHTTCLRENSTHESVTNLTPPDKTGHLQCAGFPENSPLASNEAIVQSNQCRFMWSAATVHHIVLTV